MEHTRTQRDDAAVRGQAPGSPIKGPAAGESRAAPVVGLMLTLALGFHSVLEVAAPAAPLPTRARPHAHNSEPGAHRP